MGRKYKKECYKKANMDFLKAKIQASNYTGKQVSTILGYKEAWFTKLGGRDDAEIAEDDMAKLAMLLGFNIEEGYLKEEPKEEPKKEPTESTDDVAKALAELNKTCVQILEELRKAINGPEPIALSKSERATEILRKELYSANGGGVKVEGFKKMLVQAQIGSAYMAEAINNLDCHKMVANNGIQYIMPPAR